jgi:glycosyltransferase involved in cell wall biosynthesis
MIMKSEISVIMPVYNCEKYVGKAIESILAQSFSNFEFIIINDRSIDASRVIISSYTDDRIRIYDNETNLGVAQSLNKAISYAGGEFIAVMHADDISLPHRFETQLKYLKSHHDIGVCGSYIKIIGNGENNIVKHPTAHDDIVCTLLFQNPLCHPSIMMRKAILEKHSLLYDKIFDGAEDYDIWIRISRYCKLANIDKVLLHYRIHNNQITIVHSTTQTLYADRIRTLQLKKFIPGITLNDITIHNILSNRNIEPARLIKHEILYWLNKLKTINQQTNHYPEPAFSRCLKIREKWIHKNTRPEFVNRVLWLSRLPAKVTRKVKKSLFTSIYHNN